MPDGDISRIKKPVARPARGRRGCNSNPIHIQPITRRFNPATIAALRTSSGLQSACHRGPTQGVGDVTPGHHGATVAVDGGRGVEQGARADPGAHGLTHGRIVVLPAAAHLDQTATGRARGQQARQAIDPDLGAGQGDAAAGATGGYRRQGAARHRHQAAGVVDQQRPVDGQLDALQHDFRIGRHARQGPHSRIQHQVGGGRAGLAGQQRRLLRGCAKHIKPPLADALAGGGAEGQLGGIDEPAGT